MELEIDPDMFERYPIPALEARLREQGDSIIDLGCIREGVYDNVREEIEELNPHSDPARLEAKIQKAQLTKYHNLLVNRYCNKLKGLYRNPETLWSVSFENLSGNSDGSVMKRMTDQQRKQSKSKGMVGVEELWEDLIQLYPTEAINILLDNVQRTAEIAREYIGIQTKEEFDDLRYEIFSSTVVAAYVRTMQASEEDRQHLGIVRLDNDFLKNQVEVFYKEKRDEYLKNEEGGLDD